jgi:hypothetical protein
MLSTKLERPGVVATALSALAFDYSLLPPMYSLGAEPAELPRLVIFGVSPVRGQWPCASCICAPGDCATSAVRLNNPRAKGAGS